MSAVMPLPDAPETFPELPELVPARKPYDGLPPAHSVAEAIEIALWVIARDRLGAK